MAKRWQTGVSLVVLTVLVAALMAAAPVGGRGTALKGKLGAPIELFNGKDLSGWAWHPSAPTLKESDIWSVKDGVLHCAATRVTGFIDTEKSYKNFVLTVEYRHLTNANGGVFVCIAGEEKVWPDSVQIQGKFGNVGDLLNQNTGMKHFTSDPARTKKVNKDVIVARMVPPPGEVAEKPIKEWNTLVITMENGNVRVTNNGVLLNEASALDPAEGKVGIQAEGAEMEFRKVELTPIE